MVPLAQFIGQIPGFGHVPREFKYITDVDKKLVNLDIKFQLVSRKGASDQYLSFPDDPEGHDLSSFLLDPNMAKFQTNYLWCQQARAI